MVGKVDGAAIDPDVGNGGRLISYGGGGNPSRGVSEPWLPREFE
jgi:hypothetical protein